MFRLNLNKTDKIYRVLCLGAHSDDIEIGCGGTVLRLIEDCGNVAFDWVVFSSEGRRGEEAADSAAVFLEHAQKKNVIVKNFRDGFFPFVGAEIKQYFERLKREISPDLIFTHYRGDLHQDHRLISELTWNTFRDHFILEYEIPKYDGDLGSPNFFSHLNESISRRKTGHILENFRTQTEKPWFTEETFLSLLRIRGVESRAPGGYAEAFHCRKMVF